MKRRKLIQTFEEINPRYHDWRPTPSFKQPDDRWTGYHDPVTGIKLPYNRPTVIKGHYHPGTGYDDRCGACIDLRSRARER